MTWRAVAASVAFVVLAWFFMGGFGMVLAVAIVLFWWVAAPRTRFLWILAVACMAAAPIALVAQGIRYTTIVGTAFGFTHWIAGRLVETSLALGAFAGAVEGLKLRPPRGARARVAAFLAALIAPAPESPESAESAESPADPGGGDGESPPAQDEPGAG